MMDEVDRRLADEEPEANRIRVVAIDDHPTYVHGLATLLEDVASDIEVVGIATEPEVGLNLVLEHEPDVVLLDLHMPRLEGLEVAKRIRAFAPEANVVMLTVSDEREDVSQALRAGAKGFLRKDVRPEELVSAIRSVAGGGVVLAPFAADALFHESSTEPHLTDEEIRLLRLIATGAGYADIAAALAVSESTLKRQLSDIQRKLNVENKIQAVAYLARKGLL